MCASENIQSFTSQFLFSLYNIIKIHQLKGCSYMKHVTVCVQKAQYQSNLPSFT